MATKKSSAGGFKQMPKMETTEPSVILKLKKGGHVNAKLAGKGENGFSPMSSSPKYRESMEAESGNAPKKPSMGDRKKAMNPNFKDGGKIPKMGFGGDIAAMVKRFQDQAAQKKMSQAQSVPTPTPPKIIQQLGRAPSMGNTGGGTEIFNAASKPLSGLTKDPQAIIKGGGGGGGGKFTGLGGFGSTGLIVAAVVPTSFSARVGAACSTAVGNVFLRLTTSSRVKLVCPTGCVICAAVG